MSTSGVNALRARAAAANAALQNKSYIKPGATVGKSASTGIVNNNPFRAAIGAMPQATPFYIAAPGKPSAPMSESSSARRAAEGLPPTVHGGIRQIAQNANNAIANSTYVRTSPNYKPVTTSGAAPTSTRTAGTAVTPSSAPAPSAPSPTSPTDGGSRGEATPIPAPTPTTSGGTGGTVSGPTGPQAANYGGAGRGAGREGSKTNRRNPRAAKSTTMDELKKQAAKRLGV